MLWWMVGALALAGKYDGQSADIEVSKVVQASPEAVHALLADWKGFQAVMPESCVSDWEIPSRSAGLGARSRAKYTYGPLRRRLVGVYTQNQPGLVLETELEGKKGWFLQVTYAPADAGTRVTFKTPLEAPEKWPVAGAFFNKVKPAWEQCYLQSLEALGSQVGG